MDRGSPITTDFSVSDGTVVSYDKLTRRYKVRVNSRKLSIVLASQLDLPGIEIPYAVDDCVVLQRIPPSGVWVILGRIPKPRVTDGQTLTNRQPSGGDDDDSIFTEDGDFAVTVAEQTTLRLSRGQVFVAKVAELCSIYLSKTANLIQLVCQTFTVRMKSFFFKAFVNEQTLEPAVQLAMTSELNKNDMKLALGGLAADSQDGLSLALGAMLKLLIQLLPGDTQLTYTQNVAKVSITAAEFLQQFGDGSARWTSTGLVITKGATTLTIDPTSLAISTQAMTLTLSTLNVTASGNVTISAAQLIQQNYYWLTVVQRLNQLLLVFSTHTHQAGPIQTSSPTGSPVNEKGTPIGTPVLPAEIPLPI